MTSPPRRRRSRHRSAATSTAAGPCRPRRRRCACPPRSPGSSRPSPASTPRRTRSSRPPSTPAPPPAGFRNARPVLHRLRPARRDVRRRTSRRRCRSSRARRCPTRSAATPARSSARPTRAARTLDGSGVTVAIIDAYACADDRLGREHATPTNHGDGAYAHGPAHPGHRRRPHRRPDPTTATRPAGSARRRSTSRPCTPWLPAANIRYYGATSCYDDDFLTTLAQVVDQNKAQHRDELVGRLRGGRVRRRGRGVRAGLPAGRARRASRSLFSSGDDGDELAATGIKQVDYPSSDPYVTGVGGTVDRDRRRRRAARPDRLGHLDVLARRPTASRGSPAATSTAPAAAARRCSTSRATRTASSAAAPGRCPTFPRRRPDRPAC